MPNDPADQHPRSSRSDTADSPDPNPSSPPNDTADATAADATASLADELIDQFPRARFLAQVLECLPTLRKLARRFGRNEADAEDLVQAAQARALGSGAWAGKDNVLAWMVTILHHLAIDESRRERRERCVDPREVFANLPAPALPESNWWQKFTKQDLVNAAEKLPEPLRQTFLLHLHRPSLNQKEMGSILGVKQPTVSARLTNAYQQLRNLLAE